MGYSVDSMIHRCHRHFPGFVRAMSSSNGRNRISATFIARAMATDTTTMAASMTMTTTTLPAAAPNRRLSLTLYRQLLRWCDGMDQDLPLSHHVPPLHLQGPRHVNLESLRKLRSADDGTAYLRSLLPSSVLLPDDDDNDGDIGNQSNSVSSSSSSSLTVPIATVRDLRNLFRALFRMNAATTTTTTDNGTANANNNHVKEQISLAFDGIRSLNVLTERLDDSRHLRQEHTNREGVQYRVGQVVQLVDEKNSSGSGGVRGLGNGGMAGGMRHPVEPRGVIVGWRRVGGDDDDDDDDDDDGRIGTDNGDKAEEEIAALTIEWKNPVGNTIKITTDDQPTSSTPSSTKTSLTEKVYESVIPDDKVRYDVILDMGDNAMTYGQLGTRRRGQNGGDVEVYQSDLKLVEDPDLLRIRSPPTVRYRMQRFDPDSRSFVPAADLAYLYPNDVLDEWSAWRNPSDPAARDVMDGIQTMATMLRRIILDCTSQVPPLRQGTMLTSFLDRLTRLSKGDVLSKAERLRNAGEGSNRSNSQRLMKSHIQELNVIVVEMGDHLLARRTSKESKRKVRFSIGEVVRHKKYGFRGVIVSWDPEPVYDVTQWDGLQHIDHPEQYPFYNVIPDPSDSVAAFGVERPHRYVCEENLESCPKDERRIDVDLQPDWTYDSALGRYLPPDVIQFRHGDDWDDDGMNQRCLEEMRDLITSIYVSTRDSTPSGNPEVDDVSRRFSIGNLYELLKNAEDFDTAVELSDLFKELWKAHCDKEIRYKLDTATDRLIKGKTEVALSLFGEIIDQDADYAEAWNKASTCEFMIGNLDASMAAAQRTLEIIPNHFQALNGLGLVYHEKKDLQDAVDCFRKSMSFDPWSPVAPRLSACLTKLKRWERTSLNMDKKAGMVQEK